MWYNLLYVFQRKLLDQSKPSMQARRPESNDDSVIAVVHGREIDETQGMFSCEMKI